MVLETDFQEFFFFTRHNPTRGPKETTYLAPGKPLNKRL